MATRQRISGGGVAKTCPKCGAELWDDGSCLPCDWRSVPAQPARCSGIQRGEQLGDQPSDWRRWATGSVASALGLLSLWGLTQVADAASCDSNTEWCLISPGAVFVLLVLPLWVIAAPFALATVLPFGRTRRVTVALGTAMLAGAVTFAAASVVVYYTSATREAALALILSASGIAFCLALYSAYRLAR